MGTNAGRFLEIGMEVDVWGGDAAGDRYGGDAILRYNVKTFSKCFYIKDQYTENVLSRSAMLSSCSPSGLSTMV